MSLVLVRIDCRLIHGQIIEAWVPSTRADLLVVANDQVAEDHWQRTLMEMSVPTTLEIAVLKVQEAASVLNSGRWEDKRVILLFANCRDAWLFCRSGLMFDHLNLGNLYCAPGKTQITRNVALDQNDMECLQKLQAQGIRVEVRLVPKDHSKDLSDIVDQVCIN
ncbi:MAG: PTS sugar transporter subunit IIB [Deltaproteobacteria bacterium]|nr:PTS sugar transporter subunit IIB [Deltaproteobacteria bacterium]